MRCRECKRIYTKGSKFPAPDKKSISVACCPGCRAILNDEHRRLSKRNKAAWLRLLSDLPDYGQAHVASIAWWDFQYCTWEELVERYPFMVKTEAVSAEVLLKGLLKVGYSNDLAIRRLGIDVQEVDEAGKISEKVVDTDEVE